MGICGGFNGSTLWALGRALYQRKCSSEPAERASAAKSPLCWPAEQDLGAVAAVERARAGLARGAPGRRRRFLPRSPPRQPIRPAAGRSALAAGGADGPLAGLRLPLLVVVEKILGPEEPLPEQWPVAGTTGYDFLTPSTACSSIRPGLAETGRDLQPLHRPAARLPRGRLPVEAADPADVDGQRAAAAGPPAEPHLASGTAARATSRSTRCGLRCARSWPAFPSTAPTSGDGDVSERDRQFVCRAAAQAKRRNPAVDAAVFDFVRDVLLLEQPPDLDEAGRRERELFVGRFQQVTSPVMAKGIEDTAFYRYLPLLSLNEVGGDPARGAATRRTNSTARTWPGRPAGPARCWPPPRTIPSAAKTCGRRINVLSEIPHLWRTAVNRWARLNRRHRREVDGQPAPSRNDEYLFYQTLVGVWPLAPPDDEGRARAWPHRMQAYMEKATREAKVHTSWINPDAEYDAAVRDFVAAALDDQPKNRFLDEFRRFHQQVVDWGLYTRLVPSAPEADLAGRARHLPGPGALGLQPGGP